MVVGAEIAKELAGELDVMLVKKLRAPDNPELALGAVAENGHVTLNDEVMVAMDVSQEYLDREIAERRDEMARQRQRYCRAPASPANRQTILVDDGLATGATMLAAVQATASSRPAKLVVAVPVSPPDTARKFSEHEFVCLETPLHFQGVGQFYEDFTQVEDEEVIQILKSCL